MFEEMGADLIAITYAMSCQLYERETAITLPKLQGSVQKIVSAFKRGEGCIPANHPLRPVLQELVRIAGSLPSFLKSKKPNPHQRLLIHQALIDDLIHLRRSLVFPPERVSAELQVTVERFKKIQSFLQGLQSGNEGRSPLWGFEDKAY